MGNDLKITKKQEDEQNYPCKKQACEIQNCLSKNNYDQNKCQEFVEIYNKCVKDFSETKQNK